MNRADTNTAYEVTAILTYTVIECGGCGVSYALSDQYIHARRQDHKNWTCPNGCVRHYPAGSSEAEKAKEAQALAERRLEWERTARRAAQDQAAATERSNRALKGVVTKTKRRVAAGVCPVPGCKRHFADLQRHIGSKHPDYSTAQEH